MIAPDIDNTKDTQPWHWEENGYTVTRSVAWSAPGCHNGCGVLLYTKDGKLEKVEGDPDNHFNNGRLCVRCLALPEYIYHKDRITHPLKRVGERGENKWQPISWDEAFDTIVARFNEIKANYGAESVVFAQGTGRDICNYLNFLALSFGSPNITSFQSGIACFVPRIAALMALQGGFSLADCGQYFPDRFDNPEYKLPECIVLWGNDPTMSNADGFFGHWVVDCMKRGSKLIVIDPRMTWLASKADIWLPIRPGTDSALALGMLNVIISEELYDKEFVDKWTTGFDKLTERAAQYPVDKVAEITWIPKEKILTAARLYAKSKPAATQWGLAVDQTKESVPAAQAILALWSITGNTDVPGGMATAIFPFGAATLSAPNLADYIGEEQASKRIGLDKYPIYNFGFQFAQPDEMIETMLSDKPYPIKGLWLQSSNALACMASDPKGKTYAAFRKMDFNVVVDLFMTPTAVACADIVLPAASYAERDGVRAFWYNIQTINKAIDTVGDCKSDMEICLELGKRFNPEVIPWESPQEWFSDMIKSSGMKFEDLRERGQTYPEFVYRKHEKGLARFDGQPGFNTPTGRVSLYSEAFESLGLDPLPYFEEPLESPLSTPELYKEYPLVLTTGARFPAFFHSEHRQVPHLRAMRPDPLVEINPETAAKYGIKDGDWVWIENHRGKFKQRAKLTPIVDPRMISASHGWWFPEKEAAEPCLYGVFESNPNVGVAWGDCGRSGFGANIKSLLCKIYKVQEGEN